MKDVLLKIIEHKKKEVADLKQKNPVEDLKKTGFYLRQCVSLKDRLQADSESGIIAEFKRKSPSKSNINLDADLNIVIPGYHQAGASGISILTDRDFFGGDLAYLQRARTLVPHTPLLRKEFIIDEYQIIESKAFGADVILLIAEVLSSSEIELFTSIAREVGLEVLLELHGEEQLDKIVPEISIIGVNNRNLQTFEVDYHRSIRLLSQLPEYMPKIAESGLYDVETLSMLYEAGFSGFLIGEHFMKSLHPERVCAEMVADLFRRTGRKHIVN